MARFDEYHNRFKYIDLDRDDQGILVIRFHTNGKELGWGPHAHEEVAEVLGCAGDDRENRLVVITGTGESFIDRMDMDGGLAWLKERSTDADSWADMVHTGYRLIRNHLDIEVPGLPAPDLPGGSDHHPSHPNHLTRLHAVP